MNQKENNQWPTPKIDENDQPHFLFIITPPYSGSTALTKLLNTSHRTMTIQQNGEGQWLIPGLCGKDRWNPQMKVNYQSVKATWISIYQRVKRLTQNIDVVIEKSPPNMMRIEQLSTHFNDFSLIANNRDPYANCSSTLHREYNINNISNAERRSILMDLAEKWLIRSQRIKEITLNMKSHLLTYETFCNNPASIKHHLNTPESVAETINTDTYVKVKDYAPQPISNQNSRQISKLTTADIESITNVLSTHSELLDYYGYKLLR